MPILDRSLPFDVSTYKFLDFRCHSINVIHLILPIQDASLSASSPVFFSKYMFTISFCHALLYTRCPKIGNKKSYASYWKMRDVRFSPKIGITKNNLSVLLTIRVLFYKKFVKGIMTSVFRWRYISFYWYDSYIAPRCKLFLSNSKH